MEFEAPPNHIGRSPAGRSKRLEIILFILALLAWPPAFAQNNDESKYAVRIEEARSSQNIRLAVVNNTPATLTLFFRLTGSNFNTDKKLPLTLILAPNSRQDIVSITQSVRWEPFHVNYHYSFQPGDAFTLPDRHARYLLPFAEDTPLFVVQSPGGTTPAIFTTHNNDRSRYAFDFGVPEGTLVTAAREGIVIDVEDTYTEGQPDTSFRDKANFVAIMHDDRSIAYYVHLAPRRVLVKLGQRVRAGAAIAYSGNTGYSYGPHLHFDVRRAAVSEKGEVVHLSIPVDFYRHDGTGGKIMFE